MLLLPRGAAATLMRDFFSFGVLSCHGLIRPAAAYVRRQIYDDVGFLLLGFLAAFQPTTHAYAMVTPRIYFQIIRRRLDECLSHDIYGDIIYGQALHTFSLVFLSPISRAIFDTRKAGISSACFYTLVRAH